MENNEFKATVTAIVAKVREEARREAARDAAYCAIQSVCRALGIRAIEVSRPSLWERPMGRDSDLFDYVTEDAKDYLLELGHRLRDFAPDGLQVEDLFLELMGTEEENYTAPLCPIDQEALEKEGS